MTDPAVLIVEDDADLRAALCHTLSTGAYPVLAAASGPAALTILDSEKVGLVVSDIHMEPMNGRELLGHIRQRHPELPAILMTAFGTIENAVDAMRDGAADYLVKPFDASALLKVTKRYLRAEPASDRPIAVDARSVELLRIAGKVAASDATVTLSGESGTGKEVLARHIHEKSSRRDKPFVAINCAAIPENMLEAMLFGHEKGAFTGANSAYAGKFEQANGGTLLLDEISEMEIGLQAKILRVIQEREVERIGGRAAISLDVRVLATTNRDLRQRVTDGKFREDLFYRLNVFPLHIPPLRERKGDILPLTEMTIGRFYQGGAEMPVLADCAKSALLAHRWPGNVRELENVIQRSLILLASNVIHAEDLTFEASMADTQTGDAGGVLLQDDLQKSEFKLISEALREVRGNRKQAATRLGISPRTLRYKLAKMRSTGFILPDGFSGTSH